MRYHGLRPLSSLCLTVGLCLNVLAGPAHSAVLRVSATAPGPEHDGTTWLNAFTTLQGALSQAVAEDEIWVARGVYTGNFVLTNGIRLFGGFAGTEASRDQRDRAANETVLDGGQTGSVVSIRQGTPPSYYNAILDGFTVRNGSGTPATTAGTVGGGIYIDAYAYAQVLHNRIIDNDATMDGGGVAIHKDVSRLDLRNNVIAKNRADRNGGGVYSESASFLSDIGGNTIAHNTAAQGGGISLMQTGHWDFRGPVYNNIVAFNSSGMQFQSSVPGYGSPPALTACDVYGNAAYDYSGWTQPPTGTRGNISADPRFVDAEAGNYHLRPDSPCRDTGDGATLHPDDRDIDGQRRLIGPNPDIGADEIPTAGVPVDIPLVFVSPSGDDTNDGTTWATAKRHLYAALDVVRSPGGEVWVAAGRYTESVIVWPGVTLLGGFAGTETDRETRDPSANVTVLDGSSRTKSAVAILGRDNVLSGFTITGGGSGIAAADPGGASRIEGNIIRDNTGNGITVGSGSFEIRDNDISGNATGISTTTATLRIEGNHLTANSGYRIAGIWIQRSQARLANNVLVGNVGAAVLIEESTASLVNNTIARNFGYHRFTDGFGIDYPIAGGVNGHSSTLTLVNNIIADNTGGFLEKTPTVAPVLRNNCVYGNEWYDWQLSSGGDPDGFNGNIAEDPKLAELATGNIHIQPASPCRDAGDASVVEAGDEDMDRQPRVQGPSVDIGADESDGTVWVPQARTVRVGPTGSDESDGSSWAQAMKTVQAAIDRAATTGGEVWVAAGTYTGNYTLPAYVRLYGGFGGTEEQREQRDPAANVTVLDANGNGTVLIAGPAATYAGVDGFTIQNGLSRASSSPYVGALDVGGIACLRGSSLHIANNRITGNNGRGANAVTVESAWADIRRNTITANGNGVTSSFGNVNIKEMLGAFEENKVIGNATGGGLFMTFASAFIRRNTISGNSGIYGGITSSSTCEITENDIRDNAAGGLLLRGSDRVANNLIFGNKAQWGAGINVQSGGSIVTNNTIVGNTADYSGGGIFVSSPSALVANNIVAFNSSGVSVQNAGSSTIVNNNVFGNAAYNYSQASLADANFSEDPLFVSRQGKDFHLLPGSPCIDKGDDQYVRPEDLDIDGQARVLGASVDVGADEYLATGPTLTDVVRALRLAGGLDAAATGDSRLDGSAADPVTIDLLDAVRLARQLAGVG